MSEKNILQELSDLGVALGDVAMFLEDAHFIVEKLALDLANLVPNIENNKEFQGIISTLRILERAAEDYKSFAADEEEHAIRIKEWYESKRERVITC